MPVLWDVEGRGSNDWVLAVVTSTVAGESLAGAQRLRARVMDRFGRPQVAATVARKLEALIGGVGARLGVREYRARRQDARPAKVPMSL